MDNQEDKIQQGQEVYSSSLQDYAPAEPPPPSGTETTASFFKRFAVPLVLVVVAIGLILIFVRVLRGATAKEISLTYWTLWEDETVYKPLIADYQKTKPHVKVTVVRQTPKEYRERLENAIIKDQGPDLFRFHNTWLAMLLQKKVIAPVPETLVKAINYETSFYPLVKSDLKAGNLYYGIPLTFDGLGLYYNEKLLSSAGVAVPKTWPELRAAAKKVTVPDAVTGRIKTAGVALGTTNNIEFWSDILGLMFYQNGANPYNPTNAFAEETLLFYSLFAQPPDNVWDSNMDNSMVAFMSGKLAMMFAPSWLAIEITQANPDLKFKIVPVPQLPETPMVTWGSYWVEGVSAKSASQKEAFDFLAFLVARENLTKLYNEEAKTRIVGEPYSRVDLAQALIDHPLLGAYVVQGPNARSGYLSDRTMDNGINDRIIQYYKNAVNAVLAGSSPNQALTTAAQGITQILSQFGVASQ